MVYEASRSFVWRAVHARTGDVYAIKGSRAPSRAAIAQPAPTSAPSPASFDGPPRSRGAPEPHRLQEAVVPGRLEPRWHSPLPPPPRGRSLQAGSAVR